MMLLAHQLWLVLAGSTNGSNEYGESGFDSGEAA